MSQQTHVHTDIDIASRGKMMIWFLSRLLIRRSSKTV